MELVITGITKNNDHHVEEIQGNHGYAQLGSWDDIGTKRVSLCEGSEQDFSNMRQEFINNGFNVKVEGMKNEPVPSYTRGDIAHHVVDSHSRECTVLTTHTYNTELDCFLDEVRYSLLDSNNGKVYHGVPESALVDVTQHTTPEQLTTTLCSDLMMSVRIQDGYLVYSLTYTGEQLNAFASMNCGNTFEFDSVTKSRDTESELPVIVGLICGFKPSGVVRGIRANLVVRTMQSMADALGMDCHIKGEF